MNFAEGISEILADTKFTSDPAMSVSESRPFNVPLLFNVSPFFYKPPLLPVNLPHLSKRPLVNDTPPFDHPPLPLVNFAYSLQCPLLFSVSPYFDEPPLPPANLLHFCNSLPLVNVPPHCFISLLDQYNSTLLEVSTATLLLFNVPPYLRFLPDSRLDNHSHLLPIIALSSSESVHDQPYLNPVAQLH